MSFTSLFGTYKVYMYIPAVFFLHLHLPQENIFAIDIKLICRSLILTLFVRDSRHIVGSGSNLNLRCGVQDVPLITTIYVSFCILNRNYHREWLHVLHNHIGMHRLHRSGHTVSKK